MMTFVFTFLTALVNYFVKNAVTKAQYLKNIKEAQHRYEGTVDSAANLRSAEKILDEELAKEWEKKWGPKVTPTSLEDAKRLRDEGKITPLEHMIYVVKNTKLPVPPKPLEKSISKVTLVMKDLDTLKDISKPLELKIKK